MQAWKELEIVLSDKKSTPLLKLTAAGGGGRASCRIRPFIVLQEGGTLYPDSTDISVNPQARSGRIHMVYGGILEDEIFFNFKGGESTWHRRIKNTSGRPVNLVETGITLTGLHFGGAPKDDYFYHNENPRIYDMLTIPVDTKRSADMVEDSGFDVTAGNRWADPGVVSERIGASPYQPFPAILLSNYNTDLGIVHGTLSQRTFFHNYLVEHDSDGIKWDMLSSFKGVACRTLAPGEVLDTDRWYLGLTDSGDIETIFRSYAAELRKHLAPGWGGTPINRHTATWGSWNDGISRNIDEERLLKMAEWLPKNLPEVEWMQIDDGYATYATLLNRAHGLGAPYEGPSWIDKTKFPDGFKSFTDKVKAFGLKPAVWIGGHVREEAPLYKDNPEWFVDYSFRMTSARVLDVSLPEVRDYMKSALSVLLTESGFEGMKHDFWSYVFEDSHALLRNTERSGYEWRTWWLNEIRKRLPDYGYLQTGCDIVMGNPFLGEYFTNYRYGIDVGSGNWDYVKTNFLWGAACFATHTGDLFVPNSDSIGLLPGLNDDEALLWINFCLISRSTVETAGWLYKEPDHPRMKWLRKAICCLDNGGDVHFAAYDYRRDDGSPAIWYLHGPHFSLAKENSALPARTVAVFNLGESEEKYNLSPGDLGLPEGEYLATDAWSLETRNLTEVFPLSLPAHSSRLFSVVPCGEPCVLDSNVRIDGVEAAGGEMFIDIPRGGDATITLSARPDKAAFSCPESRVSITPGAGNWQVKGNLTGPGVLHLTFKG